MVHKSDPNSVFMSNSLKIPPINIQNQYGAIANFIVPRIFLDKSLTFFLLVKDLKVISNHSMPNTNAGNIEVLDDLIKTSFYSKKHDIVPFKVTWANDTVIYSSIAHTRCVVEISVRPVEEMENTKSKPYKDINDIDYDQVKEKIIKNAVESKKINFYFLIKSFYYESFKCAK